MKVGVNKALTMQNFKSLIHLDLRCNNISNLKIDLFSDLTSLKYLYIAGCGVDDINPLSGLTSLINLDLSNNNINPIDGLSNLTSLSNLWLDSNNISDISPLVENEGIDNGDYIDLRDNPLNSDSINIYIPELLSRDVYLHYD